MFMPQQDMVPGKLDDEFSRPVESIMRCEDFKSNFARRLSNRYISRSVPPKTDVINIHPTGKANLSEYAPERIEQYSQLSKSITEQNGEVIKPPDKTTIKNTDMRCTEVSALNMEVETLRWQLAQTEANRQMHIALLKQIVTFLSRVKEHIECQTPDCTPRKETMSARISPKSFNFADLPRSRSVLHVNKNLDYSLSPTKKANAKKISKSISNVNGYKDCSGIWKQSKLSLTQDTEKGIKITEEMTRLITLANTVLSTKLPDLACTCNDLNDLNNAKLNENIDKETHNESTISLNLIQEDTSNTFILNTICDSEDAFNGLTNKYRESKDTALKDFVVSPLPLTCSLENNLADVEFNKQETTKDKCDSSITKTQRPNERRNDYHTPNFIEDESGFSSMSSFQEIGIPIISIIPPSPCKELGYLEEITDMMEDTEKWKTDTLELDKQTVKVFWV